MRRDSGQGGLMSMLPAILGGAALLLAAGLVAFELQTQRAALVWKSGHAGTGGFAGDVNAADKSLQAQLSGNLTAGGRNPFAIVPKPVVPRPKKVVPPPPKPVPVVNALILGGSPQAILTYNGQEMTVSTGSRVDDLTVTKIDADGVHVTGRGSEMVLRPR